MLFRSTLLYSVSIAAGLTDVFYPFPTALREHGLKNGSLIQVALTNANTPAVTAYAELHYQY